MKGFNYSSSTFSSWLLFFFLLLSSSFFLLSTFFLLSSFFFLLSSFFFFFHFFFFLLGLVPQLPDDGARGLPAGKVPHSGHGKSSKGSAPAVRVRRLAAVIQAVALASVGLSEGSKQKVRGSEAVTTERAHCQISG